MDLNPLTVWAVSDGRAGIEAQALGLAEAVARRRVAEIVVKKVAWRFGAGCLPTALNIAPRTLISPESRMSPPWPDIWIATGRATLPLSIRMRRWSGGRTFVVQTQSPRTGLEPFDLVAPPTHDRLEGSNVFPIIGAPNRLTPERLAADRVRFAGLLCALPHPRVAAIIGGASKAFELTPARAKAMAEEIVQAVGAGSLLLSFTRRTPQAARTILSERLSALPGVVWDETGENPYFAFLAEADAILVTEESTNLATDAAATGKPVHVLSMVGSSEKFARFHADLRARGVARPFVGRLETWAYTPLAETDRLADELLRRYDTRRDAQRLG